MKNIYRMRTRIILYFGICLLPMGFVFFMIGGALNDTKLFELSLGSLFVIAGVVFIGFILASFIFSPFFTFTLSRHESNFLKKISFFGVPIRIREFNNGILKICGDRRGVFATDTLATQEVIRLKFVSEIGSEQIVVGDIERILFGIDCKRLVSLESDANC